MTTDQTVPVPVDMLRRLQAAINGSAWHTVADNAPSLGAATADLTALIPTPPKVGDVIDTMDKADSLAPGTLLRDNTGDIWLIAEDGELFYSTIRGRRIPAWSRTYGPSYHTYQPVIIALPED